MQANIEDMKRKSREIGKKINTNKKQVRMKTSIEIIIKLNGDEAEDVDEIQNDNQQRNRKRNKIKDIKGQPSICNTQKLVEIKEHYHTKTILGCSRSTFYARLCMEHNPGI